MPPEIADVTLSPAPLHRGPFAAIYRGWDRVHRCDVIVKVQRATGDAVATERFRREAAVMARLRHPNVVAVYRFREGDPAVLVMEYVPGQTLAARVGADGWLPAARVAGIIEAVASALDCAHGQGIVHRDVKPSNVLLPPRGPARLIDFGVAHVDGGETPLTIMGDVLGTIEYASPEQVHGNETPDARTDVYSLAAVTYFSLTGTPPFRATDNSTQAQLSVMHRQVFAEPPPLRFHREDVPEAVERVVLRGLAKAPGARYQSAGQFAAALRGAVEASAGPPEGRAMAASARRTGAYAGAAAGVTALLLAGVFTWKAEHPEAAAPVPPKPVSTATAAHPPASRAPAPVIHPAPPVQAVVPPVTPKPAPKQVMAVVPPAPPKPAAPKPAPKPIAKLIAKVPPKPVPVIMAVPPAAPQPKVPPKPIPKPVQVAVRPAVAPHPNPPAAPNPPAVPKPLPKIAPAKPAVAQAPARPAPKPVPTKPAAPAQGWLSVYARQNVAPLGRVPRLENVPAQAVYVDGKPFPALAAGRWAALPAGTHVVSFFPSAHSGFTPRTGVAVNLVPGAHLSRQILLPMMAASPRLASSRPASKPSPRPAPRSAPTSGAPAVGWLAVYGTRPTSGSVPNAEAARVPAQSVWVDGKAAPELTGGGWVKLPAGRHVLTFVPSPGLEVGPATYTVHVSPQAHLSQPIPLPSAPPLHLRNP